MVKNLLVDANEGKLSDEDASLYTFMLFSQMFNVVVRPTPSIYKRQDTIDIAKKENASLQIEGRHDPAIIHRARVVVDSIAAIVISDMLAVHYGTDWLATEE